MNEITKDFLKCKYCNKYFFTKTGFKLHNNDHHRQEEITTHIPKEDTTCRISQSQKPQSFVKKEKFVDQQSKIVSTGEHFKDILNEISLQSKEVSEPNITIVEESKTKEVFEELNLKTEEEVHSSIKQNCSLSIKQLSETETSSNPNETLRETQSGKEKPHQCKICKMRFSSRSSVRRHTIIIHEKAKSFQCQICKKYFFAKYELNHHTSVFHEQIKPFQCNICKKSFGYKSYLKTHLKYVHLECSIVL